MSSLSLTACQFMEEPGMAVQVKESKHPYDNNTNFEVCKKTNGNTLYKLQTINQYAFYNEMLPDKYQNSVTIILIYPNFSHLLYFSLFLLCRPS